MKFQYLRTSHFWKRFLLECASLGVICVGLVVVVWIQDPYETARIIVTRNRLEHTQEAIRLYCEVVGELPSELSELDRDAWWHEEPWTDVWGRPIVYRVEGGLVTLQSLGRDGLPGGEDADQDIHVTFDPKASGDKGAWNPSRDRE